MMKTKEIPVHLLGKLESDRKALYKWLESIEPKLSEWDKITFTNLTHTMWEVANRKVF